MSLGPHWRTHTNFYGVFAANGERTAGDILVVPPGPRPDRKGRTLDRPLTLLDDQDPPP